MKNEEIRSELEKIRVECGGTIPCGAVVERARAEEHPLHDRFEWDDTKAAHQHRLQQERQLIRICVVEVPQVEMPIRQYVSIIEDRGEGRAGYRRVEDVLSDEYRRLRLLEQSLGDFERFQQKYAVLEEWAAVFAAAKSVGRG